MADSPPTYWDYLKLDRLLTLQGGVREGPLDVSADELHFITVHQAIELWFNLVLRELRLARDTLKVPQVSEENIPGVVHHLERVASVFRLLVAHLEVMESLTPQDFLAFRAGLGTASGFQSFQMREVEILLGLDGEERSSQGHLDPVALADLAGAEGGWPPWITERLEGTIAEETLRTTLEHWLGRTPIQGSGPEDPMDSDRVDQFVASYMDAYENHLASAAGGAGSMSGSETHWVREFLMAAAIPAANRQAVTRVRAAILFIESYRELPLLAWPRKLLDVVLEVEEQMVIWRHRHARMVERIIGRRSGTGGSSGVDYLDATARYRVFRDIWTVRTLLLPRSALPPLARPSTYGCRS